MTTAAATILILTNDAGLGHKKAALATIAAIERRYGKHFQPVLANPIDDPGVPASLRNLQTNYSRVIQRIPTLYSLAHDFGNHQVTTSLMERLAIRSLSDPLERILARTRPHIIVTTHPIFVSLLADYRRRHLESWSIVVLVTDLANLQRLWFRKEVDLYLMPTQEAAEWAYRYGIKPDHVRVTGIPVDLRLAEPTPTKQELRDHYGWKPDIPTFLVAGSRRIHDFGRILTALNRADLPIQLVVVAGDAEKMLADLYAVDWQIPVHIFGYVDDFTLFLRSSDAIITKAGGLTVAESLAAGRPLFITQSLPLHERGNAAYVVNHGAGIRVDKPAALVEAIRNSLADDGRRLRNLADHAAEIGQPRAAYAVAKQIGLLLAYSRLQPSHSLDY